MPDSRTYSDCKAALIARRLRIVIFRDEFGKGDVDAPNVEDSGRTERTGPVDARSPLANKP